MIVTPWTLLMPDTIPRQALKPAHQKSSATVARNLGPHKSLKHMKNSMWDRCGHALSAIKSKKVMTSTLYKHYRTQHDRRHCTSALLPPVPLTATHMVMMNSTLYGGICRRTMACSPPWVVPNVMGPSAVSKHSKIIYQAAWAKKISLAQNKPLMLRKDLNVISVQRNTPHRLHYSSTRRCTKALTRSMCAACVAKLSAQQQPSTNMKRYIKVTTVFKPNCKF